jgi:hypothetical protein
MISNTYRGEFQDKGNSKKKRTLKDIKDRRLGLWK